MLTDHSLLQAALEGFELRRSRIDEQIAQVKQVLSVRASQPTTANTKVAVTSGDSSTARRVSRKRVLSPEARERMAAAQKARWAKVRGEA